MRSVQSLLFYRIIFYFSFLGLVILPLISPAWVQAASSGASVDYVYQIKDIQSQNGDIISNYPQGLARTNIAYDSNLFGVIETNPLMVYRRIDNQGTPIAKEGTVEVNVTTQNGVIKPGDYITSSSTAGKGQRATQSGYVLGVALTGLDGQNASGQVLVALNIQYLDTSGSPIRSSELLSAFNSALLKNLQNPDKFIQIIRYSAAAIAILIGFGVGFLTFSRSIPKGVEAIGRNPLAANAIRFSIILNIFFTALTIILGIVGAFIILRL